MVAFRTHLQTLQTITSECLVTLVGDHRLVLLDALPGTGRTQLIEQLAARGEFRLYKPDKGTFVEAPPDNVCLLVDLDWRSEPVTIDESARGIIVGHRRQIKDYARLVVRGDLVAIGNERLFLSSSADPVFEHSGGWPVISGFLRRCGATTTNSLLVDYLVQSVIPALDSDVKAILQVLSLKPDGLPIEALAGQASETIEWLRPLVIERAGRFLLASPLLHDLFSAAFSGLPAPQRVSELLAVVGEPTQAIELALDNGRRAEALTILQRNGAMLFGHLYGPRAAWRVLDAFGDDPDPGVVALRVLTLVKRGHSSHAKMLLAAAEARVSDELPKNTQDTDKETALPVELRMVRLVVHSFDDQPFPAGTQSELEAVMSLLPPDQRLLRGGVYNAALDMQVRTGQLDQAAETARRALVHFRCAKAPYCAFYIHLHLTLMHLSAGRPDAAGPTLKSARSTLKKVTFETPQPAAFVHLLDAQIKYELGVIEPMMAFADSVFDDFVYGDIWPGIAMYALDSGAEALCLGHSASVALAWLDRWRVQTWRTRRFRLRLEQRCVLILQTSGRLREARQRLDSAATRISRTWMDSSGENLADLIDLEDIAQALCWLRQLALERPRDRDLADRLEQIARNPRLGWRQRQRVAVWQAWSARRRGRPDQAGRQLSQTLYLCEHRHCVAPIIEERVFVQPLLADPQLCDISHTGLAASPLLRRTPTGPTAGGPYSPQERRALFLLCEGCTNKEIAREMSVSLPTVKFHLRNLYARLGVRDRNTAVAEARRLGHIPT